MKYVVPLTCLWFVFLSVVVVVYPEWVGTWQARAELAFLNEADRIGMWSE
jgi:hypothetical protein